MFMKWHASLSSLSLETVVEFCIFCCLQGCYSPQSVDRGVSVPANIPEDHPVCLWKRSSAWRHHHLCCGSVWSFPYPLTHDISLCVPLILLLKHIAHLCPDKLCPRVNEALYRLDGESFVFIHVDHNRNDKRHILKDLCCSLGLNWAEKIPSAES